MPEKLRLEYVPIGEGQPSSKGDYLCRLLDNGKHPFYLVLTWYGGGFWSTALMGPYENVTHWAAIPVVCGDVLEWRE